MCLELDITTTPIQPQEEEEVLRRRHYGGGALEEALRGTTEEVLRGTTEEVLRRYYGGGTTEEVPRLGATMQFQRPRMAMDGSTN